MELGLLLIPILVFVLLRSVLEVRARERVEKLKLLDNALRNPAVDRATVTQLAHQLTGVRPPRDGRATRSAGMAVLLALGWITLFAGLGILLLGEMTNSGDASAAGGLVSLIGFGLVTYPFALRELESRRPAA